MATGIADLRLTAEEQDALTRQGFVSVEKRANLRYFKLRFDILRRGTSSLDVNGRWRSGGFDRCQLCERQTRRSWTIRRELRPTLTRSGVCQDETPLRLRKRSSSRRTMKLAFSQTTCERPSEEGLDGLRPSSIVQSTISGRCTRTEHALRSLNRLALINSN